MTLYVVDLEAVETRYTGQWKKHLPKLLQKNGIKAVVISGVDDIPKATTPGAFLNFGGTNVYKASQVETISRLFCAGKIKKGDQFLFTDAWHPGIINLKYMSELLGISVNIHALWHAGSYDSADFLGRIIGDAPWVRNFEKSLFHAINFNYFASTFHIELFSQILFRSTPIQMSKTFGVDKIVRSGWPFEFLKAEILSGPKQKKKDLIVFPHRIAIEKQVAIFKNLAKELPEYEFVICQEKQLTKKEYHKILKQAKLVFSANLQETLGIGCYEGLLADANVLVPHRLSYKEMYVKDSFVYPSEWSSSYQLYDRNKIQLIETIRDLVSNYDDYAIDRELTEHHLTEFYFSSNKLIENIKEWQ